MTNQFFLPKDDVNSEYDRMLLNSGCYKEKCEWCRKDFDIVTCRPCNWAYKIRLNGGKYKFFCTYTHMMNYEKNHERKHYVCS